MERNELRQIEVRETAQCGKGTYAGIPFAEGEVILEFRGARVSAEEVFRGVFDAERCLQLSASTCIIPSGGPEDYVNHSCEPSAGLLLENERLFLTALRDLNVGEEITFDYSTSTNLGDGWEMACKCGSTGCRETIRDFSLLPQELQDRYLRMSIVPAFISASVPHASTQDSASESDTGPQLEG